MANVFGGFDRVVGYKPEDIDAVFFEKYKNILSQKKGGGYWLWKPYFIYKTLEKLEHGDFLFYCDAASFMTKKIDALADQMVKENQDIMGFELPLVESQWTKKELFFNMECNGKIYSETNQIMASFCLIRKTGFSMKYCREFFNYSCNEKNITDEFDEGFVQDEGFLGHRYDQSIFSLLYKKYNLRPFKDPSQFGKYPRGYAGTHEALPQANNLYVLGNGRKFRFFNYTDKYGPILFHYRRNPVAYYIKYKIKEILYLIGLFKGSVS